MHLCSSSTANRPAPHRYIAEVQIKPNKKSDQTKNLDRLYIWVVGWLSSPSEYNLLILVVI